MELSKFSIGLIFIFLPGILALLVSERLTEHPERKNYELFDDRWIELMLDDKQLTIQTRVVAVTAIIGVMLGLLLAYGANHSWLHRAAHRLRVSRKFADNDVWGYLMNSGKVGWIVFRDHSKNLIWP